MEHLIDISPKILITKHKNSLQVSISGNNILSLQEIFLSAECRIVVNDKVMEKYLLAELSLSRDELPQTSPLMIGWEIDLGRKGPITFESPAFSIEYVAQVSLKENDKVERSEEIPLKVIPGRVDKSELASLKSPSQV